MEVKTICDFEEESIPNTESEVAGFETQNGLIFPEPLRRILLETNGGYIREENLKVDEKDKDLIVGVEEVFGLSTDEVDWASSIIPLERWVKYKNEIYESYPTVKAIEALNGDISRYFVFSASGSKFHLLDYTDSENCKRICYLDLVGGDQVIITLGDNMSCVLSLA